MIDSIEIQAIQDTEAAELTARLLHRFNYADAYRRQWEDIAKRCYQIYVGWRDELPPEKRGRSNLHIPRPYEQIDALRARIVKSFFATRPYMDFIPIPNSSKVDPETMRANARQADIAAALVDQQLEKNGIVKKWYDFVTCLLVFPAAIMSVGWRYETKRVRRRVEVPVLTLDPATLSPVPVVDPMTGEIATQLIVQESEEVVWDDNEVQLVDWWDFWGDPAGHDIDSCRFVFQREWMTRDKLESKLALLAQSDPEGRLYPLDWDTLKDANSYLDEGKWERLSAVGLTPDPGGDYWADGEKPGERIEILHYWTDDQYAILVNRKQLAWYGNNPYWRHGKKPYVMASYEPLPNELYGLSAIQIIADLSDELNTLRNQRIDNVSLVLNRMWKKRRSAEVDESELVSRPGAVIELDNLDDIIPLETPDVTASSYNEEVIVKQDMESALGTTAIVRGADPTRRETATEIMQKNANAGIKFEVKIMLYQQLGLERLAYLMDMNNQQFIDTERLVKLFGSENAWDWYLAKPGEIIGEHEYRPAGSNVDPAANREVRRQQLTEMLQAVHALNMPYFDRYKLARLWAESYDLRNVDAIMVPEQVYRQQELMQQLMTQQALMPQMQPSPGAPGLTAAPGPMPMPRR